MTPWTPIEDLAVIADRPLHEIATTLGRTVAAVKFRRNHLGRHGLAQCVRDGVCPQCGSPPMMWGPAEIVAAVHAWVIEHGRTPSRADWQRTGYGNPNTQTVARVFGTLNNAVRAAGYTPRERGGHVRWTRDAILNAIIEWAQQHDGEPPSWRDWIKAGEGRPTTRAVTKQFGKFNRAIDEAGFFPRGPYGLKYVGLRATDEETPSKRAPVGKVLRSAA